MPAVPVHPPPPTAHVQTTNSSNPLPSLMHTPAGLALLEIQGTLHAPRRG
jgi:chromosome transmission fidelity protein 8